MVRLIEKAVKLSEDIEVYPLHKCGPSDDPDKQWAFARGFRDLTNQFLGTIKRIGDPEMVELIPEIDISDGYIDSSHEMKSQLMVLIDVLREKSQNSSFQQDVVSNSNFIEEELLTSLSEVKSKNFDLTKLLKMLEELNFAFRRNNIVSTTLLLRAIINHVPPIFGYQTFSQYASNAPRTVKQILLRLEDEARPIGDLHSHMTIRKKESIPTKNQVEPYKPALEILVGEIIGKMNELE